MIIDCFEDSGKTLIAFLFEEDKVKKVNGVISVIIGNVISLKIVTNRQAIIIFLFFTNGQ